MLKSLELFGFKSFADRTIFEFHEGITGVVGPNGSGKSNVVDSIKWLLGDQSAKSLRGKEMTDVIFNGSSSRGGAQFAEATLTFDNATRFLPIDYDEVSIGRRLWKSGDSEYLINNNTARLKDVRELLTGTGAGAASYCIIEQGRVDQILQSNAANRRLIFEEAAGISRFKQRRNEAERRLERVEQNLLRLTDIVQEVGGQVNSIRNQAKRAMQFRELSTELQRFWVGMVADDFRRQSMVRERLEQEKSTAAASLAESRELQAAAESQLAEADQVLSKVDEQLRDVEGQRADLRSQIASLESTLRHYAAREKELNGERERLKRQRSMMDGRVTEAEKEQAHLQNVLNLEQQRFDECKAEQETIAIRLRDLNASLNGVEERLQEKRNQLLQLAQQISQTASERAGVVHQCQSHEKRLQELTEANQLLDQEIEELETQLQKNKSQMEVAEQALKQSEEAADALLGRKTGLIDEQSRSRDSLSSLREQRSAVVARKTVLEDLEDRQEGFGIGAREILRRAESGVTEPWNLIKGSVADLLDVDMQNAALLEVALSGRAQLLVIDRLDPLVTYLNSGRSRISGRVGFVSLENADGFIAHSSVNTAETPIDDDDSFGWKGDLGLGVFDDDWLEQQLSTDITEEFVPDLKVTWVDEDGTIPPARSVFSMPQAGVKNLTEEDGIVGRADRLARSPKHLPGLAAQLLADTWVVKSLDQGLKLQQKFGPDYRFVTLQGELIEKDGTLFTGSVRSEAAVVSRKSELRRLKNELLRVEHLISERDHDLKALIASIEATDTELQAGRDAVDQCAAELRSKQQQYAQVAQTLESSRSNQNRLTEQLLQLDSERQTLLSAIEEFESDLEERQTTQQALQQELRDAENGLIEDRRQVEVFEKQRNEADLKLTRTEERLLGIRDALDRLEDDLEQRQLQQQEASRRLIAGDQRLQEISLSRLNTAAEVHELQVTDDRLTGDVFLQSQARDELQSRRRDAMQVEQETREACRVQESRVHEVELRMTGIDHQLSTSAERIRDEFAVEVEDAIVAGKSAIVEFLLDEQSSHAENKDEEESDWLLDSLSENDNNTPTISIDDPHAQQILRNDDRYEELRQQVDDKVTATRKKLKRLGNVGTESLDNLTELENRYERLNSQLMDLEAARDALREMVKQINVESRRMFEESFECVRGHFRELFRRLFGGGEADVILEDPEDILECAIDVVARPPGKELRSISLLSGGEKTMTAVALLLSIFRSRPSPFCLLDEVDAALDDANIGRFVGVLKDFQQETQFIMITHRKPTMAVTDVLYGVTMEESGISKRLVVRFEEIDDKGNFAPRDDQKKAA